MIPYTSIIEQTADVFRKIAGEENVLEHHANVDFDKEGDLLAEQHRHASENWDVPIVVTTNVQFFESLYSNKTSRCRKLHNLANSVIIFDEAQMLPLPYLLPCVRAVASLVKGYGVSAVLCTATQPSLGKFFPAELKIRELCPERKEMYRFFRRTSVSGPAPRKKLQGGWRSISRRWQLWVRESRRMSCFQAFRRKGGSIFPP